MHACMIVYTTGCGYGNKFQKGHEYHLSTFTNAVNGVVSSSSTGCWDGIGVYELAIGDESGISSKNAFYDCMHAHMIVYTAGCGS